MRRTLTHATAAVALMLGLASCASTKSSSDAANPSTSAAPTTATAAPTPSADQPMTIGTSWGWQDDTGLSGSTTVLGYQQPVATDGATPEDAFGSSSHGYVWAAVEVNVCVDQASPQGTSVSSLPWTLTYSDGTRIQPSDTGYDSFPKPAFPMGDTMVAPGRCLRGKIVFPVPGKQRPALIDYSAQGLTVPEEWTVPAKA